MPRVEHPTYRFLVCAEALGEGYACQATASERKRKGRFRRHVSWNGNEVLTWKRCAWRRYRLAVIYPFGDGFLQCVLCLNQGLRFILARSVTPLNVTERNDDLIRSRMP